MKVRARGRWNISLDEFFGFEKLLQVSHLPGTHNQKDGSLRKGPPQNALVGAFTRLPKSFLSNLEENACI